MEWPTLAHTVLIPNVGTNNLRDSRNACISCVYKPCGAEDTSKAMLKKATFYSMLNCLQKKLKRNGFGQLDRRHGSWTLRSVGTTLPGRRFHGCGLAHSRFHSLNYRD